MAENETPKERLEDLVARQNAILSKIQNYFSPEQEETRRAKLVKVIAKIGSIALIAVSGIFGAGELGIFLFEQYKVRALASDYAEVGKTLLYEENNAEVSKQFVGKALELTPDNSEFLKLDAYIDGMAAVRDLYNLDRPYNATELKRAYEALAKSELLRTQAPGSPEPYILRGQIYAALKDYSRARSMLKKAIEINPKNDFALMRLGAVAYSAGDTKAAISYLNKAIVFNPKSKWAHLWLGIISSESKDFDTAETLKWFEKALEIDPRFDLAHYNIAWNYLRQKPRNYEMAEKSFRQALALNPDYKEAVYGLAMAYGYQRKYKIAHSYLSRAIEIDPLFLTGWKWRAIVNDEMKAYDKSLDDFSEAIKLDPANSNIYMRRARVYTKKKSYTEAMEDLLLAKSLNPKNPRISFYLSRIYRDVGQLDAALSAVNKALELRAKYADAYGLRAEIKVLQQDYGQAYIDFQKAIDSTSYRQERFLNKRAAVYFKQNKPQKAMEDYTRVTKLAPENAAAWLGLTRIYVQVGAKDKAGLSLSEFIKLKPNNPNVNQLRQKISSME